MKPIVVSFYTPDGPYPEYAMRLEASCKALGIDHLITEMNGHGSWVKNVAQKGPYMLRLMETLNHPILWVDVDAEIISEPKVVYDVDEDFAIYADLKPRKWKPTGRTRALELPKLWPDPPKWFLTGTVFFNNTQASRVLLETWAELCQSFPTSYQQLLLQECWCQVKIKTIWLPQSYCKIRHMAWRAKEDDRPAVIVHDLASVRGVNGGRRKVERQ